jgi:predicted MFS family arabinose efflux permease
VDALAYLTSRYFGLRHYGVMFALMLGIYTIGSGIGSALAGMAFDRFGSYDMILMVFATGCAVAVILALTLGHPPKLAPSGDGEPFPAGH